MKKKKYNKKILKFNNTIIKIIGEKKAKQKFFKYVKDKIIKKILHINIIKI